MNYAKIRDNDIANGEGVRVSLFVSGCTNNCPGCFNPEEKDFSFGKHYTEETHNKIIKMVENPVISGLTILGGDPLCQDIGGLLSLQMLCDAIHNADKTIWLYTGYVWENIESLALLRVGNTRGKLQYELLKKCDIVVDGPFIQSLSDGFLKWRGSSNQRIIDVAKTLDLKEVKLYYKEKE